MTSVMGCESKRPPSLGMTSLPKAEVDATTLSYPPFSTKSFTVYDTESPNLNSVTLSF